MTNYDGEDISWQISTPWNKIALPISGDTWSDFVWTVCHYESKTYICQGFHYVNRDHYIVATVPYKDGDKECYVYDARNEYLISWPDGSHEEMFEGFTKEDAIDNYLFDNPPPKDGEDLKITQTLMVIDE